MSGVVRSINAPPRLPRALFLAAFAVAAARVIRIRKPAKLALTPGYRWRRDRSIAHLARQLGRPIIAAGEALEAFAQRGTCHAPAPAPPPRRLDPIAVAIIASPAVAQAIGRPAAEACEDAAWVEVRRDAPTPHLKLYWRGEFIQGERMSRLLVEDGGVTRIAHGQGETVGSSRRLDMDRFAEGVAAAQAALQAAGIAMGSFVELKRVNTPAFKGAIATLSLARARPLWAINLDKQAGMAR